MKEIKITELIVDPAAKPFKGMTNSGRQGFTIPIQYKLEDGQVIPSRASTERKKDLPDSLDRMRYYIAKGAMFASFNEGRFWGTVTKIGV